jgi:hypothetical protein
MCKPAEKNSPSWLFLILRKFCKGKRREQKALSPTDLNKIIRIFIIQPRAMNMTGKFRHQGTGMELLWG